MIILSYKIEDRIILGIVSGIIGGIPGRLLNAVQYNIGLSDVKYGQMAANLFLPTEVINSKYGKVTASLVNHSMISITGVLITYVLSATGRDKAVVKGAGIATVLWMSLFGLTARLGLAVKPKKPLAPVLSFIDHMTLGVFSSLISSNLGHDALFPDATIENEDYKLPLISNQSSD